MPINAKQIKSSNGSHHKMSFRNKIDIALENRYSFSVDIDADKGFFNAKDIKSEEIRYLLNKKYEIAYRTDLLGKKNYYLVKPRGNESAEHFLLVKLIEQYLKPHFNVWLFHSVKPDVEIKFKNRFIAMEIETGKLLKNNKREFLAKIEMLNENYGTDWFFIVTNRNLLKKYRKYGKTFTRKSVLKRLNYYITNKPKELEPIRHRKDSLKPRTSTYFYKL